MEPEQESYLSEEDSTEHLQPPDSNFDSQLGSLYNSLNNLISTERSLIDIEHDNILKEIQTFNQEKQQKLKKFYKAKSNWEKQCSNCTKLNTGKIIELNIGGTHTVVTSLSTLLRYPNSALYAFFTMKELPVYKDQVFIDREGIAFCDMVSYLRSGKFPEFDSPETEMRFLNELEFWGVPIAQPEPELDQSLKCFDMNWCSSNLILEKNCTIMRKLGSPHGIAFADAPLTRNNPYIEFKLSISSGSSNGSHVFLGVVDKSKYSPVQLMSTRWKDAPSSYYWEVWNSKLIKTDENGVHSVVNGYGCECDDEETSLGVYYNAQKRTLSFFKKGICQGVAFSNVSPGMHPSIDVWFETGSVVVSQKKLPKNFKLSVI